MKTIVKLDLDKKPWEQDGQIHNRWHPDLPMVAMVKPGDEFRVECMDWTGGQIGNNDSMIRDFLWRAKPCHKRSLAINFAIKTVSHNYGIGAKLGKIILGKRFMFFS